MSGVRNELLPTSMEVGGAEYAIRSDYRAVLDICAALSDPELDGQEKAAVALEIFYPDFDAMPTEDYQEAVDRFLWFLNCGEEQDRHSAPRLVDWQKDLPYIVAPINRVTGREIRAVEYLHWWTFIAAYYEIGDCLFAQIVRIRDLQSRGKPLDKQDREFYRRNKQLVDMKTRYTEQEDAVLSQWLRPVGGEKRG